VRHSNRRSTFVFALTATIAALSCSDDGSTMGGQTGQTAGKTASGAGGGGVTAGATAMGTSGAIGAGNAAAPSATAGMTGAGLGGTQTGGAGAGAAGMQGAAGAADDGKPTFSGIYEFELRSCKVETCHGRGIAGVNMASKQGAYDSLINQPSSPPPTGKCMMLGKQRVVPKEPENSLMYLKLDSTAPCGQQMPPGGQLSQKARDRIRDWIAMGAKND
jgi:hypothetical protein